MFASIFVLLYAAHMLSDYPLQTDHQASCKANRGGAGWLANLTHAGTHVLVSAIALTVGVLALELDLSAPAVAITLAWIGFSHSIIDRRRGVIAWMKIARQTEFQKHGGAAHVDQTAHILALVIAALVLA